MNEKLVQYKEKGTSFWKERTSAQKGIIVGSILLLITMLILLTIFGTKSSFVPLYSNLTVQETGQIKETLDARGIASEISDNGTTISVPDTMVDTLKVELAAEGIPRSGSIDYGFFRDRMGIGITDNEFSLMERAAVQTELGNLIRNIDGVNGANVMITLPEERIWVSDELMTASASIVINTAPGYQLEPRQIRALYHLVSKSVPNLPVDNIVIMNQMFEHYEYRDENSQDYSTMTAYEHQRKIKQDIERDLQRQLTQMLGTMMGRDSVLVSVTTDIDFTQENRQEEIVTPVNEENMEGLAVSIERITETYEGEDVPEGGVAGTGEAIPGYPGVVGGGNGSYERIEERVNNDVNRIRRDIVESPYKIRDLGIQVMVEPPDGEDELPIERLNDIQQILSTIVRTSIDGNLAMQLTPEEINEKIFVSSQQFAGKVEIEAIPEQTVPNWLYVIGGILVAIIILLIFLLFRKKKQSEEEEEVIEEAVSNEIPDLPNEDDSISATKRKQLERMAREKPDEFAKLIRTWLADD
ncbi:flagellar basal-body MS-ring/collar protein FliF [Alkalihalobacterium alkalinitrilicum]|uniref:flagellar basal-body MS-ring/collar protein FliF n=1 Tax=Alkalihalobacterium alkalinitrilicum TaxID=427920 RepID=UPI0009953FA2|nr:flagellar basal-body MS-ring/collar protein FliF [Alkalihalobacterium alkalinitrilicum]